MSSTIIARLTLVFSCQIFAINAWAQTQISPRYSVDADVNTLTSYGDTLIVGGNFYNVGVYTGGIASFTTTSDEPDLSFPKISGYVKTSTPDGSGGFYIYGIFRKESEDANGFSYPRIEHIKSDKTFDTAFSLPVNALFGVNKLLYHQGLLYIGSSYMTSINNQLAGDLAAIDVITKLPVTWIPSVTISYLGGISGMHIRNNCLYITGGFTEVGGQPRKNIAAIQLYTGIVKAWDFAANFAYAQGYSDIEFYQDKVIISGGFANEITPQSGGHACAITDTISGLSVEYIFKTTGSNPLYFAAGAGALAIKGDTLFAYTSGTFDTRVTAINLATNYSAIWKKYFNMIANAVNMEVNGSELIIGGTNFSEIYLTNISNSDPTDIERKIRGIVKLNTGTGNLINYFPDPVNGSSVLTLSLQNDKIFIGGNFTHVKSFDRTGIVMIKASTQEILPFNINLYGHSIRDFKIIDTTLYAAGGYFQVNGVTQNTSVLSFSLRSGALLPWASPGLGTANTIEGNNQYIFIGGDLAEPGNVNDRKNLFAINRQTGALSSWSPNPNLGVLSLHLSEGKLYAGGNFTNISGAARNYLASFDTATSLLNDWNPNPDWIVTSIESSYGTIWVGGYFGNIGGVSAYHFAGLNSSSGAVLHKPLPAYAGAAAVNAIAVEGCHVIVGSNFRKSNLSNCNDLFVYDMYNKEFLSDSIFCQDINDLSGNVKALSIIGDEVYFGGTFSKVNGKSNASNLERIKFPAGYFAGCGEYISIQNGNWDVPATWEAGRIPPGTARVRVRHNVTLPVSANCFSLHIENGGFLQVNSGVNLKIVN